MTKGFSRLSGLLLVLLLTSLLCTLACGTQNTAPSSSKPAAASAAQAQPVQSSVKPSSAVTSTSATAGSASSSGTKTLKLGLVAWMGWPMGLDMTRGIELMVKMDNERGGLEIGGEKYKIEVIKYDSNNAQATEVAAINRLVFEDKVQFIMADGRFDASWLAITDANKVLVATNGSDYRKNLVPTYKYDFYPSFYNNLVNSLIGWIGSNYKDKLTSYTVALPDNAVGHIISQTTPPIWQLFGITQNCIFYPTDAQDLSSLGTKIAATNPSAFAAAAGGTTANALVYKAVYSSGYRGQLIGPGVESLDSLTQVVPAECLEGLICGAWPVEFENPPIQAAKEYKDAYVALYGKWDSPGVQGTGDYAAFRAAFQKAGSTDVDKVAAVIFNGMKYESPSGSAVMISRPDLGNNRTVDSICTAYIKQIKNGSISVLSTISQEEALKIFQTAYPPAAAAPSTAP
jgi:branched-chain amino acid transport system substrate-binding protein